MRISTGNIVLSMEWLRCFLLIGLLAACTSQQYTFSLTKCNDEGTIELVEGRTASVTCTGLVWGHNIYWTVTSPTPNNVETTVGECSSCVDNPITCLHPCVNCQYACSATTPGYTITRTQSSTTVHFPTVYQHDNGTVVKCSSRNNVTQTSCTINVIKAYKLEHCFGNRLSIVKDKITTIRCTGLDPSQNMYWAITDSNGNTMVNARCNYCPNGGRCPACKGDSRITVTRSGRFSDLQIVLQRVVYGWHVRCSKSDNATFEECPIRVKPSQEYSLPQCKDGTLELSEVQPQAAILCEGLWSWQNMNWTITDDTGSPIQIGYCRKYSYVSGSDCIAIDSDLHFERNASLGRLTINKYTRNKFVNKLLTCIRHDGDRWDSCKIRVVYPAEVSKPNVTLSSWNLLGTIMINTIYDSYNDVVCWWRVIDPALTIIDQTTRPTLFQFLGGDGRQYYNGTCTVSLPLNVSDGVHHLELIVLPGGEPLYVGNVSLDQPGDLLLEPQTCPVIVAEGSSLECKCHHAETEQGSPPAFITWLNGDNSSVLNISNVNKGLNGTEYTCRSEWGPTADLTKTLNYALLVAYGPTSANVTSQINLPSIQETLNLTCTLDEVYPAANFSWSVPCVTLTLTTGVSTCDVAKGTLANVPEVVCTAYNSGIPALNTSAVYNTPAAYLIQNEGLPVASVVGGVVAAVFVIGTIIVVVIIIVKRKRSSKSTTAEQNEGFVEYTNDLYDSTREMESSSRDVHNSTQPPPTASTENANSLQNSEESANPEEAHVNTGPAAATNPNGDVYAQIAKKRKNATPDLQSKQTQNIPNETYAQVQKKQKGKNSSGQAEFPAQKANDNGQHKSDKEETDRSTGLSKSADSTEYVNCLKESTGENSGAVYMNLKQSSSPEVEKDKAQVSETDDEYNKLHVTNTDAQEAKSPYNHLGDV